VLPNLRQGHAVHELHGQERVALVQREVVDGDDVGMAAAPGGPRGIRWLLVALLRLAPAHDPLAVDLGVLLPDDKGVDHDRAVERLGLSGLLRAGLECLAAMTAVLGDEADLPLDELYREVLPGALTEHELLRAPR